MPIFLMQVYRTWKNTPEEAISIIINNIFFTSGSINFSVLDHNILWIDCFSSALWKISSQQNIYWEYTRGKYHTGTGSFWIILNSLSRHCPSMYQSEVMDLEHHVVITYWIQLLPTSTPKELLLYCKQTRGKFARL